MNKEMKEVITNCVICGKKMKFYCCIIGIGYMCDECFQKRTNKTVEKYAS